MNDNIVPIVQSQSPFDAIRRYRADGSEFWDARELMPILGYKTWQKFSDSIDRAITACTNSSNQVAEHFLPMSVNIKQAGRPQENYQLSRFACYLIAMNGDPRKPEIAEAQSYFAVKTREAEIVVPQQNARLLMMQLENENLRLANENMRIQQNILGLQNNMLCLHGAPVVLALAGKSDQVVELEKEVTVIVEPETGNANKIMTADQLKKFVASRTGQKLPSLKWFADKLRDAGRDDLLVAVTRHSTSEYPKPDLIDEAMQVVYNSNRQGLIGE